MKRGVVINGQFHSGDGGGDSTALIGAAVAIVFIGAAVALIVPAIYEGAKTAPDFVSAFSSGCCGLLILASLIVCIAVLWRVIVAMAMDGDPTWDQE